MTSAHDGVLTALDTGTFNVVFDNGAAGTANRSITIDIPQFDNVSATPNPGAGDGTMEYACEGVVKLLSGSEFLTITVEDDNISKYID